MVMNRLKLMINIMVVTSVIGLAISYLTTLLPNTLPHLSFLEGVGVYCLWTPMHHTLMSIERGED